MTGRSGRRRITPPDRRLPAERSEASTRGERGREAEGAAAAWLEAKGLRVIVRNHGTPVGEVDLVCRDGETTCFVEVRSRAEVEHGAPAETVSRAKALRVVRAARDWLAKNGGEERPIRFDVVAVTLADGAPAFEHFPAAFDADGDTRLW